MPRTLFPTPEDAEQAFYEAVEASDLDALMAVWAEDDEIVCVHPNGERLLGQPVIRESWRKILASGRKLHVRLEHAVRWQGLMLATHSVVETVLIDGESEALHLAATNVYVRGPAGWRMLVHHASPIDRSRNAPAATPPVLH
jgi:ketosteroid isomerase-like protein